MSVRTALRNLTHARCTNAGLWHDVYIPRLRDPNATEAFGETLRKHLEQVAGTGVPDGYRESLREREELLRGLRGAVEGAETRCFDASAQGRIVVGLGVQSVLESNVALLRAWGVPYIPGSALKGLASSAAHRRGGEAWRRASVGAPGGPDAKVLFGDTAAQGIVTFHDAWWMPDNAGGLPLDLDVMTVHHPDYYGHGTVAPLDWDEPNPVSFLTARGTYLVALTGPRAWLDIGSDWLKLALDEDGIGAKTHAGYGRMSLDRRWSEDEKQRKAFVDDLKNLPAQHSGASTARLHLERLGSAFDKRIDADEIKRIARALYDRDPSFWQRWARDVSRTETERGLLTLVELIPSKVIAPPAPKASEIPSTTATPSEHTVGDAWLAKDSKNRPTVFVRIDGRVLSRERRLVTVEDSALVAALDASSEKSPVSVRTVVRGKDKLDRLDPA